MSEMVDRVARALFQRDVDEDICDGTWEESPALHEKFFADARAAIKAMREPTEVMVQCRGINLTHYSQNRACWEDMIEEALK